MYYDYIVKTYINEAMLPTVKIFNSEYEACLFEADITAGLIQQGFIYKQTIRFDNAYDAIKIIYINPKNYKELSVLIEHSRKFNLQKLIKKVKNWIKKE